MKYKKLILRKYFLFKLFSILIFLTSCQQNQNTAVDKIYINAVIWTGDSSNPRATAIGIKDSLIFFVDSEYDSYKGENTEIIDLQGKMIVPGFIDNHTHFLDGGYRLASVNLRAAQSQAEFTEILKDFTTNVPEDRWIQGGDWDHEAWGGELPHRNWIDSVTPNNPLFVNRYDGHMALANTVTLNLAGIDKNTPNPPGGEIVKDPETGEPTGVLKDEAMGLVYAVLPPATEEELDESLERALTHAYENGVTQIHDMGSHGGWIDLETYQRAHNRNNLALRIYSFVPLDFWEKLNSYVEENGTGDDVLRWGGLKGFVDGSLGSTTAFFYEPYLDEPHTSGLIVTDTVILRKQILGADSVGLHLAIHAIGDRANDWLLDVFEEAKANNENSRFRIEHAQHLSPEAISRFNSLGIIPSMQPYHAIDDGKWADKRLDRKRLEGTYAFKSLIENDAMLTFGSDWTVGPLSPILGIYAAVTRRTLDDKNPEGWFPEQKLTVEEALISYTRNNAYAGFFENKTGILRKGMLADFVVLSDDLLDIPTEDIKDVMVLRTIINGKEVFKR